MSDTAAGGKGYSATVARKRWTQVEPGRLTKLQESAGLSNIQVATELGVTERTWARYKQRNRIETGRLARAAEVFGAEVARPEPPPPLLVHDGDGNNDGVRALRRFPQQPESQLDLHAELAAMGASLRDVLQELSATVLRNNDWLAQMDARLERIEGSLRAPRSRRKTS